MIEKYPHWKTAVAFLFFLSFLSILIGILDQETNNRITNLQIQLDDNKTQILLLETNIKDIKQSLTDVIEANEIMVSEIEKLQMQVKILNTNQTQFVSQQKYDCDKICLTGTNCRQAFGGICYDFNGVPDCLIYCNSR